MSLLITQVKRRQAWSAPGWVPAARCKIVAAVGFWCLVGSLLRVESCELGDFVSMNGRGVDNGSRQKRRKACIRTGATDVSLCTMETVSLANIQRELAC
jgi:hypothetical protein